VTPLSIPAPGTLFVVTAGTLNTSNTYWSRLVNRRATLLRIEPDGLWSMLVDDDGYASPVEGVKPERFMLAPSSCRPMTLLAETSAPMPAPEPRKVWWKRFFTWLGE
jgi:hypothetical protein